MKKVLLLTCSLLFSITISANHRISCEDIEIYEILKSNELKGDIILPEVTVVDRSNQQDTIKPKHHRLKYIDNGDDIYYLPNHGNHQKKEVNIPKDNNISDTLILEGEFRDNNQNTDTTEVKKQYIDLNNNHYNKNVFSEEDIYYLRLISYMNNNSWIFYDDFYFNFNFYPHYYNIWYSPLYYDYYSFFSYNFYWNFPYNSWYRPYNYYRYNPYFDNMNYYSYNNHYFYDNHNFNRPFVNNRTFRPDRPSNLVNKPIDPNRRNTYTAKQGENRQIHNQYQRPQYNINERRYTPSYNGPNYSRKPSFNNTRINSNNTQQNRQNYNTQNRNSTPQNRVTYTPPSRSSNSNYNGNRNTTSNYSHNSNYSGGGSRSSSTSNYSGSQSSSRTTNNSGGGNRTSGGRR